MMGLIRKLFGLDRRYRIGLIASEYEGHQGVPFTLFHHDGLTDELYKQIIPKHLHSQLDSYLCSAADETFSRAEVKALRQWFKKWPKVRCFKVWVAKPITEDQAGVGLLAVGGTDDFYMFSEAEDFPVGLPKIWGYLNLSAAESGPYVRDPSLSLIRVHVSDEGQPVIKLPPF